VSRTNDGYDLPAANLIVSWPFDGLTGANKPYARNLK
jgi:hypothetical protein